MQENWKVLNVGNNGVTLGRKKELPAGKQLKRLIIEVVEVDIDDAFNNEDIPDYVWESVQPNDFMYLLNLLDYAMEFPDPELQGYHRANLHNAMVCLCFAIRTDDLNLVSLCKRVERALGKYDDYHG